MMSKQIKLSEDFGDCGDEITHKTIYIYHIRGVKVGSSTNYKRRVKDQGYDPEDVEILMQVIPHCTTYNHVWVMEQVESLKLGYAQEHEGQRLAVNRTRSSGVMNKSRNYILTSTDTGVETTITDAAGFELEHELSRAYLSRIANPKTQNKFLTLDGIKYTVSYADA